MRHRPIAIAVGFVLTFTLGLMAGRLWGDSSRPLLSLPSPEQGPAPLTTIIDGVAIQHDPSSHLSVSIDDYGAEDQGTSTLSRQGEAVGPALRTSSERVGSAFEAGSPTVGSVSGGTVLSTIEAVGSTPLNGLYLLGGACVIAGAVAAFGFKMPGLGLGLALGGGAVCIIAWFASSDQRMLWFLIPLSLLALGFWLYQAGVLHKWLDATSPITKGIATLERLDPAAHEAVTSAIAAQAGPKGTRKRRKVEDVVNKSLST